jgi:hypothetical protein
MDRRRGGPGRRRGRRLRGAPPVAAGDVIAVDLSGASGYSLVAGALRNDSLLRVGVRRSSVTRAGPPVVHALGAQAQVSCPGNPSLGRVPIQLPSRSPRSPSPSRQTAKATPPSGPRSRHPGEGELAGTGAEAEDVPAGDAELAGLVPVAGFGVVADLAWAVGLGVADGDGVGTGVGEAEDGAAAGLTPTVAAGSGLMSR